MADAEFSPGFARVFRAVASDLRAACAAGLVWKDACQDWLDRAPVAIGQHRHPYCLAVKADPARQERCRLADNLEADAVSGLRCRTCPFGVVEVAVPVLIDEVPAGLAWVGSWREGDTPPLPALASAWCRLPPFPGRAAAMAMGRLVQARLAEAATGRRRRPAELAIQAGDAAMADSAAWIASHASASLRAGAAAAVAGLSVSRYLHRFRDATGATFAAHRDACVMELARRRLADPGRRIIEVALDLGFASHSRFCEAFRRHHRLTPSAWRLRRARAGA